jgi:hypothetical protein
LRGVEVRLPIAGVVIDVEGTARVVRLVDTKVVDAIGLRSQQGIVTEVDGSHGKTRTETGDPGNLPTLRPAVRGVKQALHGKFVGIAHHKVIGVVEGRQGFAELGIDGIDRLT